MTAINVERLTSLTLSARIIGGVQDCQFALSCINSLSRVKSEDFRNITAITSHWTSRANRDSGSAEPSSTFPSISLHQLRHKDHVSSC